MKYWKCLWINLTWKLLQFAGVLWTGCYVAWIAMIHWHSTKKPVTTMLTYPWKCTVLHCNHLGNTWKPLVLMTRHFDYCPSASKGDNQSVRSSAPVVSRCFPGGYNVKLYISRGRLAWWLLAFLHSVTHPQITIAHWSVILIVHLFHPFSTLCFSHNLLRSMCTHVMYINLHNKASSASKRVLVHVTLSSDPCTSYSLFLQISNNKILIRQICN